MVDVRKGMPGRKLDADAFEKRYLSQFTDPAFEPLRAELKGDRFGSVGPMVARHPAPAKQVRALPIQITKLLLIGWKLARKSRVHRLAMTIHQLHPASC
jgi:hypothetical protein